MGTIAQTYCVLTVPVLFGGVAALGPTSASDDAPLPPNACNILLATAGQIPQTQEKQLAVDCNAQQNAEIVVMDLSGLSKKAEQTVASDTEEALWTSDAKLIKKPKVVVLQPSNRLKRLFRRYMDQNPESRTHNIPDPGAAGSPSELVLKTDPQLANAGLIATLDPQHGITAKSKTLDGIFGVDYEDTKFATIYTNNGFVTRDPYEIALFLAHEDEHDEGIGHTGILESYHPYNMNSSAAVTTNYGLLSTSWPRVALGKRFFSKKLTGDQELGGSTIMGQWQSTNADAPALPPPELDRLRFARSILDGKEILGQRDLTEEGLMLNKKEVLAGIYATLNLAHPIPFTGSESGLIQLGQLALVPKIGKTGEISSFSIMGYDNGNGNVVLIGTVSKPSNILSQELLLQGQTVHITYGANKASLKVSS
jgi:hypothetical protein